MTVSIDLRLRISWSATHPLGRPLQTSPPVDIAHLGVEDSPTGTLCRQPVSEAASALPAHLVERAARCVPCEHERRRLTAT